MDPVRTKDCNLVYKGPTQEIGDLWVHRIRPHMVRVTFQPDEEELEVLKNGGRVQLFILKEPIPPVSVQVVTKEGSEPYAKHGWKIDVDPGDVRRELEENGEEEDDESSEAEPETQSEASSSQNGQAPSADIERT